MVHQQPADTLYIDDTLPGSAADRQFRQRIERAAELACRTDAALGILESGTFFQRKIKEMQAAEIEAIKIAA